MLPTKMVLIQSNIIYVQFKQQSTYIVRLNVTSVRGNHSYYLKESFCLKTTSSSSQPSIIINHNDNDNDNGNNNNTRNSYSSSNINWRSSA